MNLSWSPDDERFLYSRPDGISIIDLQEETQTQMVSILPYQTGGDWAWVPGTAWSPDGNAIYTIEHIPTGSPDAESSQRFDLVEIPIASGTPIQLKNDVGMFSYPVPSPLQHVPDFLRTSTETILDQDAFRIAYLQAIFPDQSETSGYRLCTIDRDGSNRLCLFPEDGLAGLAPQHIIWSPEPMDLGGDYAIAFIYNGNIWFVDTTTGSAQQVTGDGLTSQIDWR